MLLVSGRVSVPKPLSQIQRSTRWLLQGLSPRTSFGGFGLNQNVSTLSLTNSTVSNNTAIFSGPGSGIYNPNGATLILTNTIIAKNHGGSECSGTGGWSVTSLGHNLDSDGTCGLDGTGDLSNTDPLLGPLQDNGGPTLTHALLPDSPAIDSGDDAVLGSPHNLTTDQRGFPRLLGAHLDIGAYEAEPPQSGTLTVTKTGDTNDGFCGVLDCSLREAIPSLFPRAFTP